MADKEITDLPASAGLVGSEEFVVQTGPDANEKATAAQIASYVGSAHPGYIAGNWYNPLIGGELAGGAALVAGSMRLFPFTLAKPITISDLGCRVTTIFAGGNVQLAIYGSAAGLPTGNPVASTANISTAAAGTLSADITGANVTLAAGALYWMAVNSDNATAILQNVLASTTIPGFLAGAPLLANVSSNAAIGSFIRTYAQAFGTWPDLTGQTTVIAVSNAFGIVFLKAA